MISIPEILVILCLFVINSIFLIRFRLCSYVNKNDFTWLFQLVLFLLSFQLIIIFVLRVLHGGIYNEGSHVLYSGGQ